MRQEKQIQRIILRHWPSITPNPEEDEDEKEKDEEEKEKDEEENKGEREGLISAFLVLPISGAVESPRP